MESWRRGGRREAAQKRWPNLPPQPISSTLAPVPLFKTTFALFRPFRIATRSAVIPSASAFYIHAHIIYIYIYIFLLIWQFHALCYYVSLHTETWTHTEQWQGCLKLDVLVIRRHSYTGRSCNRRPGRLLQATIRICLHNQDNNGNSERRAGDYFGQCDIYIYMYTHTDKDRRKKRRVIILSHRQIEFTINWNCLINFCGANQMRLLSNNLVSVWPTLLFSFIMENEMDKMKGKSYLFEWVYMSSC